MRVLVRVLPTVSAILVAIASFALSYVALRDVAARTHAVPGNMAWLTPICVDGAVLAASASLWSSSMRGQRKDPVAVLTAVLLLVISVVINISHAGPAPLAKVIAALPPLTLLACLELVANQYRREAEADTAAHARGAAAAPGARVTDPADIGPSTEGSPVEQGPTVPTVAVTPEPVAASSPAATSKPAAEVTRQRSEVPTTSLASVVSSETPTAAERASAARVAPEPARAPATSEVTGAVHDVRVPHAPSMPVAFPVGEPVVVEPVVAAESAPRGVDRSRGGDEVSGAVRIRELFQLHLDNGGSATDPSLSRTFAETLDLQPAYVRKVLGPLRRELEPVG